MPNDSATNAETLLPFYVLININSVQRLVSAKGKSGFVPMMASKESNVDAPESSWREQT
jgi:hypothetical protein